MLIGIQNKVRPEHTALVVIDYQNEFCHPDGVFAKAGFDVAPFRAIENDLARLVGGARRAGVRVLWVRCTYSTPDNLYLSPVFMEHAIRCWNGRYSKIPVCAEGSWGQKFYGKVQPAANEAIVSKHRYDAFIGTMNAIAGPLVIALVVVMGLCVPKRLFARRSLLAVSVAMIAGGAIVWLATGSAATGIAAYLVAAGVIQVAGVVQCTTLTASGTPG